MNQTDCWNSQCGKGFCILKYNYQMFTSQTTSPHLITWYISILFHILVFTSIKLSNQEINPSLQFMQVESVGTHYSVPTIGNRRKQKQYDKTEKRTYDGL